MKIINFGNFLLFIRCIIAGLGLLGFLVLGGCVWPGTTVPIKPSTTGILVVNIGFGASAASGYECKGNGTVRISSASGASQNQLFSFSGISSSSSPACNTAVTFSNLNPDTWTVQIVPVGIACSKQVVANNITTATIRVDGGTCQ